jgi:hypothetical protein
MWFLVLLLLVVVVLSGALTVSRVRLSRRRKRYGDWDFATRDTRGVDPSRRATNEADLDMRSNGRLRRLRDNQDGSGSTF